MFEKCREDRVESNSKDRLKAERIEAERIVVRRGRVYERGGDPVINQRRSA